MIIAVTGTPGTGKTTVATYIASTFGFQYIDGKQFFDDDVCIGYDETRECSIIDTEKWIEKIKIHLKINNFKDAVIDSHFSHDLAKEVVDLCIVTVCDRTVLQQRLAERGYKKEKIEENIEAEIMEVCLIEAEENEHQVRKIDTTTDSWKNELTEVLHQ